MSALIRLSASTRLQNYLRFEPATEAVRHRITGSSLGVELSGATIESASGEKEGEPVEETIRPNQKVAIKVGTIRPHRYHALIEVNPLLYKYGTVNVPHMAEPGEAVDLHIYFRADKQVRIADLTWMVRLYLLD